jgi:hypothetical protein
MLVLSQEWFAKDPVKGLPPLVPPHAVRPMPGSGPQGDGNGGGTGNPEEVAALRQEHGQTYEAKG